MTNFDITIQSKDLLKLVTLAGSTVERRNVIPILNNLKLEARGNLLIVTATDMSVSVVQAIGAQVKAEGIVTASCQILSEIIKKIPDSNVHIKLIGDLLEISAVNCKFHLPVLPAQQFPTILDGQDLKEVTIMASELVKLLEYTRFSVAMEETRYNLSGIHLNFTDSKIVAASMDGHRLSVAEIVHDNKLGSISLIIPRKTVSEIIKIFTDTKYTDSSINISLGSNIIKLRSQNLLLSSKLVDSQFPNYESFIPRDNNNVLVIAKSTFASAIDRVDAISMDKLRSVKISLSQKFIEFRSYNELNGEATERIELEDGEYTGEQITIGFNPKYLLDICSAITEESISLYVKDSSSPALLEANKGCFFVIMPVRV